MKVTLVTWLAVAAMAAAQQPGGAPRELRHCYVEATNVSNYDELRSHWEPAWGAYDRDHFHGLALKIRVGTTDSDSGRVMVSWFWLGRKLLGNDLVIYGGSTKEVEVPRAYFTELFAVAPPIRERDRSYVLTGARYITGTRHEGWVVSVRDRRNRILGARASSEPMLELFRNQSEFEKLLFPEKSSDRGSFYPRD